MLVLHDQNFNLTMLEYVFDFETSSAESEGET